MTITPRIKIFHNMSDVPSVDVLAVAAHRDDVEQTCGGTLLRMHSLQLRTAILDLTQGEAGTRGSAEERAAEAEEAARILCVAWQGRHPDHYNSSTLGYEACFLAGLAKIETGDPPFRPFKIVYASLYADVRPSFVIDITPFVEERFRALLAYRSQYADQPTGGALFVPHDEIRERTFSLARHYGLLGGVRYAEPFVQKEVGLVDDLTLLPVSSI
jgi:LmbE family N-acetylglucosaminyl deacetylase